MLTNLYIFKLQLRINNNNKYLILLNWLYSYQFLFKIKRIKYCINLMNKVKFFKISLNKANKK